MGAKSSPNTNRTRYRLLFVQLTQSHLILFVKYISSPTLVQVLTSEDMEPLPGDEGVSDDDGNEGAVAATDVSQRRARITLQQYYGGELQHFEITHM